MRRRAAIAAALALAAAVEGGRAAWIPFKAGLAQVLLARAWQRTAAGGPTRPWPWADTWPVARLRWPAEGVDLVVLAGAAGASLAFGPGHLDGTAAPGADGNCVLAGHRDTHFAFLAGLTPGDLLELEDAHHVVTRYRVVGVAVTDADDQRVAAPTAEAGLTLVTCWPFVDPVPGGRQRFVVRAARVGFQMPGAA